jgi:hypothetical protein
MRRTRSTRTGFVAGRGVWSACAAPPLRGSRVKRLGADALARVYAPVRRADVLPPRTASLPHRAWPGVDVAWATLHSVPMVVANHAEGLVTAPRPALKHRATRTTPPRGWKPTGVAPRGLRCGGWGLMVVAKEVRASLPPWAEAPDGAKHSVPGATIPCPVIPSLSRDLGRTSGSRIHSLPSSRAKPRDLVRLR